MRFTLFDSALDIIVIEAWDIQREIGRDQMLKVQLSIK